MAYLDNKATIFVLAKDAELSARGFQFRVKNVGEIRSIPIVKTLDIIVHNTVKVSPAAVMLASKHNIPIHFINNRGDYYGTFSNGLGANIFLRKRQYECRNNETFVLNVAHHIVAGKRDNQQWVLDSLSSNKALPVVERTNTIESYLGQEGKISALYWNYFSSLIKNPDFDFRGRTKRPPLDEINALLSFGYVLLVNRITSLLLYIGLDPYLGFYHQDFYKRPALALDLMEEWRPLAVDKFVLTMVNRREISKNDFIHRGTMIHLAPKARNAFIAKWYTEWGKREFRSPQYGTTATFAKFCEWQCRKFSKVITGELPNYEPFYLPNA